MVQESASESVIASDGKAQIGVRVKPFPLLLDGVDVENFSGLAILGDFSRRCSNRQVDTESLFLPKNFIEHTHKVLLGQGDGVVFVADTFLGGIYWVNHYKTVKGKMTFDQRNDSFSNRPMSYQANSSTDVAIVAWFQILGTSSLHFLDRKSVV